MLRNFTALQAFEAVGSLGSVTAAANALGVSPGAISQQIHKLEAELQFSLLERSGRGLTLTTWGRIYHAEIKKGLGILSDAESMLKRAHADSGLTISSLTSVINKWIGREIFSWHAQYPGALINLVGTDVDPDLRNEEVDFRIYYGESTKYEAYTQLFTDWVVPACAPELIAGRPPVGVADILEFPLLNIVWKSSFKPAPTWSEWASSVGLSFDHVDRGLTHTLSSSAIEAAIAGRGFVLAQYSFITDELKNGRLVIPFDHRVSLRESYYLAWNRSSLQKPFGKQFHRWITSAGRRQNAISAPRNHPPAIS